MCTPSNARKVCRSPSKANLKRDRLADLLGRLRPDWVLYSPTARPGRNRPPVPAQLSTRARRPGELAGPADRTGQHTEAADHAELA